jgi:streptogramin lyase
MPDRLHRIGLAVAAASVVTLFRPAAAQSITEFPLPVAGSVPFGIAAGPDGALWFTEYVAGSNGAPNTASRIGRITTAGAVTEFALPDPASTPQGITAGPDGALWFFEAGDLGGTPQAVPPKIGRITTGGAITEFAIPYGPTVAGPTGAAITLGSDGALWFPVGFDDVTDATVLGRITSDGAIAEFSLPQGEIPVAITAGPDGALWIAQEAVAGTAPSMIGRLMPADAASGQASEFVVAPNPQGIAPGPDGALWFIQGFALGRVTTGGAVTEQTLLTEGGPNGIAAGPDGALWFAEQDNSGDPRFIARVTTGGTATSFVIPTDASAPRSIVAGPDGAMWFTESAAGRIGRVGPLASTSPLVAAVLPSSRSVQTGATATAFATMINAGTLPLQSCAIVPVSAVPAGFLYQTTDPATNALTGAPNTPVTIAAGGSQSFFLAFSTNATFTPIDTVLGFDCAGADAAASVKALNTLLLSSSATPVPDVIALSATPSGDGILDIAGPSGAAGFAVASANIGIGGELTVAADTGAVALPLGLTICETDPTSGECQAPPAPSVAAQIAAQATPTFSVFATAEGAVPFAPDTSRIFVRFTDATGEIRGTTSVAVRTQ